MGFFWRRRKPELSIADTWQAFYELWVKSIDSQNTDVQQALYLTIDILKDLAKSNVSPDDSVEWDKIIQKTWDKYGKEFSTDRGSATRLRVVGSNYISGSISGL